ncbi:TetR family transcriptional regulator [Nakamurella antarctica]|uniref:TetR family transcriptional regulator n=1 Tax=Nakamurella antarctica TaxID=1902245 RepID=A0A3G8ZSX9_9ACTN|nr:TetR/AcrR family transcriptional regulator [Nakamurella antarctica]AZI57604.1 TetR family transcriptional regulator [Nakamurella antarctica]
MAPETHTKQTSYGRKGEQRRIEIIERAIALFARRSVGSSLREIGEEIGVSHAALRYYFATRDQLLVEIYRTHEAAFRSEPIPLKLSAVSAMDRRAAQNAAIPGLVALYATLSTDALQRDNHPVTREFIQRRFVRVRSQLAERVREGQRLGLVANTLDPHDVAALIAAASDGLQLQQLLDPEAVDTRRSLSILEHLLSPSAQAS